jgi:hypothetical protein
MTVVVVVIVVGVVVEVVVVVVEWFWGGHGHLYELLAWCGCGWRWSLRGQRQKYSSARPNWLRWRVFLEQLVVQVGHRGSAGKYNWVYISARLARMTIVVLGPALFKGNDTVDI